MNGIKEKKEKRESEEVGAGEIVLNRFGIFIRSLLDDLLLLEQDTLIRVNEPLHGLLAGNALKLSDDTDGSAAVLDTGTSATENDVDIHTEDTDGRIVLDTKIDVLLDTETEVSSVGEVLLKQLVLLNLQGLLENLLSLRAADGGVDGDLLVTADTEGTDSVAGLGVNGGLSSELVEDYKFVDANTEGRISTPKPLTRIFQASQKDESRSIKQVWARE